MNIIREPVPAALDDLMDCCRRAAVGYRHAAEIMETGAYDGLFEELARDRDARAGELQARIREIGEAPHAEDEEGELLEDAVRAVRKAFAADEKTEMIDEREEAEDRIIESADAALEAEGLSDTDKALVEKVRKSAEAAKTRLAKAESAAE